VGAKKKKRQGSPWKSGRPKGLIKGKAKRGSSFGKSPRGDSIGEVLWWKKNLKLF
jgi:hypothetical protein